MDPRFSLLPLADAQVWYAPGFIAVSERGDLMKALLQEMAWQQQAISIQGKSIPLPRLTAWHGNPEAVYRYSGIDNHPSPWTPALDYVRQELQNALSKPFNSVLGNWYRNGSDSVSWHSDDERGLGPEPLIASVSLGESRKFSFKHKRLGQKFDIQLHDGDVLVMQGATQKNWLHQIPKTARPIGERLNLTFRQVNL